MGESLINLHVVCEVRSEIILKKNHINILYAITTQTCKEYHHTTYINSKIISMGKDSRNTYCSVKSTL